MFKAVLFIFFIFPMLSTNLYSVQNVQKSIEVIDLNSPKEKSVPQKKWTQQRKRKFMIHWWGALIFSILFILYIIIKRKS